MALRVRDLCIICCISRKVVPFDDYSVLRFELRLFVTIREQDFCLLKYNVYIGYRFLSFDWIFFLKITSILFYLVSFSTNYEFRYESIYLIDFLFSFISLPLFSPRLERKFPPPPPPPLSQIIPDEQIGFGELSIGIRIYFKPVDSLI